MKNIIARKGETALTLILSLYIGVSYLLISVSQLAKILSTHNIFSTNSQTNILIIFFWSISYMHMILFAICGIFLVLNLKIINKGNSLNNTMIDIKKLIFISIIAFSGAKIVFNVIGSIFSIRLVLTQYLENINKNNVNISHILRSFFQYYFEIILVAGIIMFCIAMVKNNLDYRFKKIALYTAVVGAGAVFISRLINLIYLLTSINYILSHKDLFGNPIRNVFMQVSGSIISLFIPVAVIIVVNFGIKYSENFKV